MAPATPHLCCSRGEGARVLLADISPENANATLAEIEKEGGEAAVFIGDLSKEADCAAMVDAAVTLFGKVNVLFNNVGLGGSGMVTQVEEEKWDRVMDVNLKSMIMACKHAVPRMAEAGGGSIINVSSIDRVARRLCQKRALCRGERRHDFHDKGDGGASRQGQYPCQLHRAGAPLRLLSCAVSERSRTGTPSSHRAARNGGDSVGCRVDYRFSGQ